MLFIFLMEILEKNKSKRDGNKERLRWIWKRVASTLMTSSMCFCLTEKCDRVCLFCIFIDLFHVFLFDFLIFTSSDSTLFCSFCIYNLSM